MDNNKMYTIMANNKSLTLNNDIMFKMLSDFFDNIQKYNINIYEVDKNIKFNYLLCINSYKMEKYKKEYLKVFDYLIKNDIIDTSNNLLLLNYNRYVRIKNKNIDLESIKDKTVFIYLEDVILSILIDNIINFIKYGEELI